MGARQSASELTNRSRKRPSSTYKIETVPTEIGITRSLIFNCSGIFWMGRSISHFLREGSETTENFCFTKAPQPPPMQPLAP